MNADILLSPCGEFRPNDGVLWSVEKEGILVIDELRGVDLPLAYPRAAVWDLLARGRTVVEASGLLRFICSCSTEDAEDLVKCCVDEWRKDGWLRPVVPDCDHGQRFNHDNM